RTHLRQRHQPAHLDRLLRLQPRREQQRLVRDVLAGHGLLRVPGGTHVHHRHLGGMVMSSATVKGRISMSAYVRLAAVALALLASAGCDDILDVTPPDQLPSDEAIVDAGTARAA